MSKHWATMDREELAHRQEGFGDCVLDGTLWEHSDGRKIWSIIVASPTSGRPDVENVDLACCVSGDEFRCAHVGITIPELEVVTGEPLTDIDPAIKEAVVAAIQKWESEEAGRAKPEFEV
jgi:hypothetical protein